MRGSPPASTVLGIERFASEAAEARFGHIVATGLAYRWSRQAALMIPDVREGLRDVARVLAGAAGSSSRPKTDA